MKKIPLGSSSFSAPAIIIGCMRLEEKSVSEMEHYINFALENGANYFDHADIYAGGESERIFGEAFSAGSFSREELFIQSKCGIRKGMYDLSKDYILSSVDGILSRLRIEYLDALLLHRPDALVEPEEVAAAFDSLQSSGKVKYFGVSNHKPAQIELLKKYVSQPLLINQLQLSIPVSNMIANGIEVNMDSPGSANRDGDVLDYCRLNDITIQAWSPFQKANWAGTYINSPDYEELNAVLDELAEKYNATKTAIGAAWILRHPAKIQVISGTSSINHLKDILSADSIELSREEWYRLYLAAGHPLP